MCAKSLQLCPTLYGPTDCSPPGSSVHGILQARTLEWVPCPPPGAYLHPGIELASLTSNLLWQFFTTTATWESPQTLSTHKCSLMGEWLNKP